MIDLHSHILPGLCDGSQNLETSLSMAEIAVEDGITHQACTPHIYPGVYENSTETIQKALNALQGELQKREIPLKLILGAEVHLVPSISKGLKAGDIPTINQSRYVLIEPSHHSLPNHFIEHIENLICIGYVPIIAHPERLTWVDQHYHKFVQLAKAGAWIQITSGSIVGYFGKKAQQWAEKFLDDRLVHIIASDAHNTRRRKPTLSNCLDQVSQIIGKNEAHYMVNERPSAVVNNIHPNEIFLPEGLSINSSASNKSKIPWLRRIFGSQQRHNSH